jgi:hypothetical protein
VAGDPFSEWLDLQWRLQVGSFGIDPQKLDPEDRAVYVTWNSYALEDELHEATQEVGWKPWATSRHQNRDEFLKEIVDLMHFLGNLILTASAPGQPPMELGAELWELYQQKSAVNVQRQLQGYDGVSGKCPVCDRELVKQMVSHVVGRLISPEEVLVCPEHGEVEIAETDESAEKA